MAGYLAEKFVDVHAHFFSLKEHDAQAFSHVNWPVILSSHGAKEMQAVADFNRPYIYRSAGIHPQDPNPHILEDLEVQLSGGKFCAVGEIGLDLFSDYAPHFDMQKELFIQQLEMAHRYSLPVILHMRRAMDRIFLLKMYLKKLPAVIFHSYAGGLNEAYSLLKAGVNAYFSFGTPVLWGAKQAKLCIKELPLERIFLETDAPWQPVRGEQYTALSKIKTVYEYVAATRNMEMTAVQNTIFSTFQEIFIHGVSDDSKCEYSKSLQGPSA